MIRFVLKSVIQKYLSNIKHKVYILTWNTTAVMSGSLRQSANISIKWRWLRCGPVSFRQAGLVVKKLIYLYGLSRSPSRFPECPGPARLQTFSALLELQWSPGRPPVGPYSYRWRDVPQPGTVCCGHPQISKTVIKMWSS